MTTLADQITVILGDRVEPPPAYVDHPRVHFVDAATFAPSDVPKCFASNQQTIIITQPLQHAFYVALGLEVRRRRIRPIYQPTTRDVARTLDQHFGRLVHAGAPRVLPPPTPATEIVAAVEPVPTPDAPPDAAPVPPVQTEESNAAMPKRQKAPRGAVSALVAEHDDPALTVIESGDRIVAIAKKRGVPTTRDSILNRLYVLRAQARRRAPRGKTRRGKRGPRAATPAATSTDALARLDGAIGTMQALRAEIERLTQENAELRERFEKARALVASFG